MPASQCPHGSWAQGAGAAREIAGGGQIIANSPDYRTELPAVGGLGLATSSAGTRLSAAVQAAADSLCCAWLQHALPDTSAATDREHELKARGVYGQNSLAQKWTQPRKKHHHSLVPLASCCPKTPGGHRAKLVQQGQVSSCDPGCVLHTPQQPQGTALVPRVAACSDFCTFEHQGV